MHHDLPGFRWAPWLIHRTTINRNGLWGATLEGVKRAGEPSAGMSLLLQIKIVLGGVGGNRDAQRALLIVPRWDFNGCSLSCGSLVTFGAWVTDITSPVRGEVGRGSGRVGLFFVLRIETLGEANQNCAGQR